MVVYTATLGIHILGIQFWYRFRNHHPSKIKCCWTTREENKQFVISHL